jgi:1-acyl-sn-glycerol-3-phosphate acyltransferase
MSEKLTILPKVLISLWVWLFVSITTIMLVPLALLTRIISRPFDKKLHTVRMLYCFFSELYIRINPLWKIRIEGIKNFRKDQVYVVISNHQSMLDIIVIQNLYRHFRWVSKSEIFSFPVMGWILKIAGDIRLERDNPQSFARLVRDCNRKLSSGSSIVIFPEGTRSTDGEIKRFKEGAFRIALIAKAPLLPIVLDGTREILPKKGFLLKISSTIKIRVLDEIPYDAFKSENPRQMADRLKQVMSDELLKIRQEQFQNENSLLQSL